MPYVEPLKLALVDDHKLFRKGLISLIEMVRPKDTILFEADNGVELQNKITNNNLPDIILMDINMPLMDGFASVQWLKENYPEINVLVVSMIEKEELVVKMLKLGVKGYLCKDVEPAELAKAISAISGKGFYYTDFITGRLLHAIQNDGLEQHLPATHQINDREMEFLKYACSEKTYQEIADKMCLSPKTIDGYRNSLFEKLNVKSRVGLVMYALRNKLVNIDWN